MAAFCARLLPATRTHPFIFAIELYSSRCALRLHEIGIEGPGHSLPGTLEPLALHSLFDIVRELFDLRRFANDIERQLVF